MTFLITGGSGFLGSAIVDELLLLRETLEIAEIRVLDITKPAIEREDKFTFIQGDVRDSRLIKQACKNVDVIIHTAAIIDWGTKSKAEVLDVNVNGTKVLVDCAKDMEVPYLIYTSSLDAIFSGKSMENIDETIPYPCKPVNAYCQSKQLAEAYVRQSNGDTLKTCILRPADIYGEGDPYHIGSLIKMARDGFYIRLGNGKSVCQHVYVRNMAHAHLQAAKAFLNQNQRIEGQCYFITDGPPYNFFKFYDQVVDGTGYKIWPKNLWLPFWLAYSLASLVEFSCWLLRPIKRINPKFSRFAVNYTCSNITFNSEKAKSDFGFEPKYSLAEALGRTIEYYKSNKKQ